MQSSESSTSSEEATRPSSIYGSVPEQQDVGEPNGTTTGLSHVASLPDHVSESVSPRPLSIHGSSSQTPCSNGQVSSITPSSVTAQVSQQNDFATVSHSSPLPLSIQQSSTPRSNGQISTSRERSSVSAETSFPNEFTMLTGL